MRFVLNRIELINKIQKLPDGPLLLLAMETSVANFLVIHFTPSSAQIYMANLSVVVQKVVVKKTSESRNVSAYLRSSRELPRYRGVS